MSSAPKKPTLGKVFVPGGMPDLTYVPRTELDLERRLSEVKDNLCKLVVVTGPTKTGKTVLVRKVLRIDTELVWIDGGLIKTEDDFWSECLHKISEFIEVEKVDEVGTVGTLGTNAKLEIRVPGFKASVGGDDSQGHTAKSVSKKALVGALRARAIRAMSDSGATLVIDDFHYLDRSLQGEIVRALKGAVFDGFPAVVIAIPHRRYDAVRVEREMNGRIEPIKVPDWSVTELIQIPKKGFPLLDLTISEALAQRLAEEAYGSPHLVQEFCKELGSGSINPAFEAAEWRTCRADPRAAKAGCLCKRGAVRDGSPSPVPKGFGQKGPSPRQFGLKYRHIPAPHFLAPGPFDSILKGAVNRS